MKFSVKKLFAVIAGLLAILAFVMMFVTPIMQQDVFTKEWAALKFDEVYFDKSYSIMGATVVVKGAVLPAICFIAILVLGLVACATCFLKKQKGLVSFLRVVLGGLIVVASVLIIAATLPAFFNAREITEGAVQAYYKLGAGPVLGFILGLVSGGLFIVSEFVPQIKNK